MLICFDPYVGTLSRFSSSEIIEMVAQAGYEGMNLPVREPFIHGKNEAPLLEAEKLLDKYDLAVPSVGFGNHIVTNPSLRSEALEHFEIVLNIAKRLNADIIAIWPNQPQDVFVEDALDTLTANLHDMLPEASKNDIALALEFEKGCPIDNYREGIHFIKSTDKQIRLTCDTYHLNNDKAEPYRSVIAMGELLGDVHISGTHRGEPGSEEDEFDIDSFMKGLIKIGYQGPLTAQYHLEDVESMTRTCEFIKKSLARVKV